MVVAKRWKEASVYIIISLFCLAISVVLFLVGFSSAVWVKKTYEDKGVRMYGLWKYTRYYPWVESTEEYRLSGLLLSSDETPLSATTTDWYRATQAMECLGLISLVLALLILLLYFCVPSCKVRKALFGMIFFTFLAVMFIVIGIAIFGSKFDEKGFDVGWSMGLAIAAALLAFISGILQILEMT
ncbi:uncharacterized protein [Mytilus edulis]|uniref:uncharacterized protein n=1 Tax=Mytilus edulis TaxID=6550 RepID=UPI0039F0274F